MRMVSNRHLSPNSVKKFKRVHIARKVYVSRPTEKVVEPVTEEPVKEEPVKEAQVKEEYVAPEVIKVEEPVEKIATPKPKSSRRKKVEEVVENNEEKPENNG